MKLEYYQRTVYGRTEYVPTGELADAVKTLTRRKTLAQEDAEALKVLGIECVQVLPPSSL